MTETVIAYYCKEHRFLTTNMAIAGNGHWDCKVEMIVGYDPATEQQKPIQSHDGDPLWELVIRDMQSRNQVGVQRYGTALRTWNGRDAARDAYDEMLDFIVYCRQWLEEREELTRLVRELTVVGLADSGECVLENGDCQTHAWLGKRCPYGRARELIATWEEDS